MPCVFRLHGEFLWPPAVKRPAQVAGTRTGVVEIHYESKTGAKSEWVAFLRWSPGTSIVRSSPPQPIENVFALSDAATWFDQNADRDVAIWIHPRNSNDGGERVAFRGAFLFTQFEFKGDNPAVDKLLRLPLVSACAYADGESDVFSELIVGQPASNGNPNDSFRFNLHIPTPFEQTVLKDRGVKALPLCALFSPTVPTLERATVFSTIVAGPVGTGIDDASFIFKFETNAKRQLGSFGFAPKDSSLSVEFLKYDGNRHRLFSKINLKRFWAPLRGGRASNACLKVLEQMGLRIREGTSIGVYDADPGAMSLRLPRSLSVEEGIKPGVWILRYRLTFLAADDTDGGDLVIRNMRFVLDLREEVGGYVATSASHLHLDVDVCWTIDDENAWNLQPPRAALRLHWLETLPVGKIAAAPSIDFGPGKLPAFSAGTLRAAALALHGAPKSLFQVESSQPQSFLPELHSPLAQDVRFALYAPPVDLIQNDAGILEWPQKPASLTRTPLRMSLASTHDLLPSRWDPAPPLRVEARLHSFFLGDKKPGVMLLLEHDAEWAPAGWQAAQSGEPYFASFALFMEQCASWEGRLSSLAFQSSGTSNRLAGKLRTGGRGVASQELRLVRPSGDYPFPVAACLSLELPFFRATALGPDTGRGDDERVTPLLIPLEPEAGLDADARFYLMIEESVSPFADRRLDVELVEDQQADGELGYVVISDEPFSISRFSHKPLGARGDAGRAIVATYSSIDRIWRYGSVSPYYHYSLPPQSVGESVDKPRRLELHDWLNEPSKDDPGEPAGRAGGVPRPYRVRLNADGITPVIDSFQRRAVEFRLTPSAEIWIRPSDVAHGYFMPEWQSYEIFRQRGELGLGVALTALRAEFLYGMPVGVEVAKETGVSRGARVAEIEALTGRFLSLAGGSSQAESRWNQLRLVLLRRAERLEVWAQDTDAEVEFAPARFSAGVQFALRHTALLRAAMPSFETNDRALPAGEGTNTSFRYHPQGLSGGALWPVESDNLFRALAANPRSSGGTLEGVALSPLGGDAAQKATFLGGKLTIVSQTRNGFIESQRVEVIGRISALWHRAKHVVVYERTANPAAQFAPLFEEDPDRTRSRRPILRKVREFIEILEHERAYPDFPQVSARSCGFLERVRFNSRIINVDSAWSRDVDDYGWEIPLWNRAAARQRPQVYPMPDTSFCCHSEGEGEKPTVAQECEDCDYLFFFADLKTPGIDTNVWPPRLAVDYVNMPAAAAIASVADRLSSEDPLELDGAAGRRRPVSRFLPGMRRFTWRLKLAARKVAINAGRSASPLYVDLESVTFMRAGAAGGAEKSFDDKLKPILEFSMQATAAAGILDKVKYWAADGSGSAGLRQVFSDLVAAGSKPGANVRTELQNLKAWYDANSDKLQIELQNEFSIPLNEVNKVFKGIPPAGEFLTQGKSNCERMRSEALGMLHGKAMLVEALLRDWEGGIRLTMPPTKAELIEQLTLEMVKAVRPAFDDARGNVANAREDVESARAILADLRGEADAALGAALARINEYKSSYDESKPWSVERFRQFQEGLFATASSLAGDIVSRIDEARQRLAIELGDLSQQIGGVIGAALHRSGEVRQEVIESIATFQASVKSILRVGRDKLDAVPFDKVTAHIAKACKVIETAQIEEDLRKHLLDMLAPAEAAAEELSKAAADGATVVNQVEVGFACYDATAVSGVNTLGRQLEAMLKTSNEQLKQLLDVIAAAGDQALADAKTEVINAHTVYTRWNENVTETAQKYLAMVGGPIDAMVTEFIRIVGAEIAALRGDIDEADATIDRVAGDIRTAMKVAEDALAPGRLLETVLQDGVFHPVLDRLFQQLPMALSLQEVDRVYECLASVSAVIGDAVRKLDRTALAAVSQITALCESLFDGVDSIYRYAEKLAQGGDAYIKGQIDACKKTLTDILGDPTASIEKMLAAMIAADQAVRRVQNDLVHSVESARAYGDRVLDAAGKLGSGGLMAAPSNILRLYSAASSAPDLAALKADIDRLRASFDELSDVIGTTRVTALFNRLGDELKALGLSFPFDGIGDRLLPADLSSLEIGKVFRSFGGAQLEHLFNGYKIPQGIADAIILTHEFNPKKGRAWVQIDINAPMPGRRSLFSMEVFKADFVDMKVTAQVRFEATEDDPNITQTGFGRIETVIDLAVAGQSMVRFEKFALNFARESGLRVEFDPKSIRLNPALQFVQDFLSMLFPDEVGGMRVIKRDGIPVGLEHEFTMPPVSFNFVTSGISNIAISNTFQLTAYPEFVLSDQFWLSRPEQPFIFSFFIIGGTGYVHVETEYRPLSSDLTVTVEAGAGGSAALGFSFGPFSGQVFITLSIALTYQKRIGQPGGGLSIGAVLVIAGYVNVASIATVGIYLLLRMTYRDDGRVDADGTLSVTIRISRFFKITARANVQYRLRDGHAQTQSSSGVTAEPEGEIAKKVKRLQQARG
ncbi:hypothetical protein M1M11_02585 [Pseudomonas azerbaijanoccidens]|uniref:hypothetical protein n=1 Tax=Pseudomonas azerbaijanoccidentalis TaxID=2842347 RepID=UPI00200B4674|nr:hypothetical protein [Pseudomonas azerbaijanoccidentalis]MCK8663765.1 hypothetical protein [Pseudomonas azerbaijanoccidentalis]